MTKKVVVTGTGAISAIGRTALKNWANALEGRSGVSGIIAFDPSDSNIKVAAQIHNFPSKSELSTKEIRRTDRFEQLALIAADEAMNQSGLVVAEENQDRIGVFVSTATGGISSLNESYETLFFEGGKKISPFTSAKFMSNGAAGLISIRFRAKGPAMATLSACASGADGIGIGWHLIRSGVIDAAITGASEAAISPLSIASLDRTGAMSRRDENSPPTPQPFDRDRDGFVMGEGAAILILENEDFARSRGAEILAELSGYGASADAFHITAPPEQGEGAARAMSTALESAQLNVSQIHYINAHGTGTILNDVTETRAIKTVFGQYAKDIPVSSTKSMTGHMMGATGALEALFSIMALQDNSIPPTINLHNPDKECDLDYVPLEARTHFVSNSMSNSFGFGGHNAVLIFSEYRQQ